MRNLTTLLGAIGVIVGMATPAQALNLDSAFSSLSQGSVANYNAPGHYANSARNNIVLGGVEARMPRSRTTLMSVTPPSLNAGCGGISAMFGGFSFVSGAQIEQLVSNIASNSTGMVINLVLKTLCPICQGVIEAMTHLSQQAAKTSIDSCSVAESITAGLNDYAVNADASKQTTGGVCGKELSYNGEYQGFMDAMNSVCSTADGAVAALEGLSAKSGPPQKDKDGNTITKGDDERFKIGNRTWELLKAAGYRGNSAEVVKLRTLMMNLLGTTVIASKGPDGQPLAGPVAYIPALTADRVMDLFMCGTGEAYVASASTRVSPIAAKVCGGSAGQLGSFDQTGDESGGKYDLILSCGDDVDKCLKPVWKMAGEEVMVGGQGFLFRVSALLHMGAEDIRANRPLANPELLGLLENVPYPVYQVLNVAAVYPVAAHDLIDSLSVVIADSMATAMFDDVVTAAGRVAGETFLSMEDIHRLQEASQNFVASIDRRKTLLANRIAMQEGMMETIRTLNLAIQREVMSDEMLGSSRFAGAVNDSVAAPATN